MMNALLDNTLLQIVNPQWMSSVKNTLLLGSLCAVGGTLAVIYEKKSKKVEDGCSERKSILLESVKIFALTFFIGMTYAFIHQRMVLRSGATGQRLLTKRNLEDPNMPLPARTLNANVNAFVFASSYCKLTAIYALFITLSACLPVFKTKIAARQLLPWMIGGTVASLGIYLKDKQLFEAIASIQAKKIRFSDIIVGDLATSHYCNQLILNEQLYNLGSMALVIGIFLTRAASSFFFQK